MRLWETVSGKLVKELAVPSGNAVLSLGIHKELGLLAVGTEKPEFKHEGGDVLVW